MTTPPVASAPNTTAFNSTWPKTLSVTTTVGDVLSVAAMGAEWGGATDNFATPTGGTPVWVLKQSITGLALNSHIYVWTAVATANETFTLSVNTGGGSPVGVVTVDRFTGTAGVGATAQAHAGPGSAPSVSLAHAANSAIVSYHVDWSEASPVGRVWRTINSITPTVGAGERMATDVGGAAVFYSGLWSDDGPAATDAAGMSAPGQKHVSVAVEVLGSASGVNGTGRAVVGVAARVGGAKSTPTTERAAAGATARATTTKTATATARGSVGSLARAATTKTVAVTARGLAGIGAAVTATRPGLVTAGARVGVAARVTVTTARASTGRATVGAMARIGAARIAVGTARATVGLLARALANPLSGNGSAHGPGPRRVTMTSPRHTTTTTIGRRVSDTSPRTGV